jgi:hypothetical protein
VARPRDYLLHLLLVDQEDLYQVLKIYHQDRFLHYRLEDLIVHL